MGDPGDLGLFLLLWFGAGIVTAGVLACMFDESELPDGVLAIAAGLWWAAWPVILWLAIVRGWDALIRSPEPPDPAQRDLDFQTNPYVPPAGQ